MQKNMSSFFYDNINIRILCIFWWLFWLSISTLSLTGLQVTTPKTVFISCLFITSMLLGTKLNLAKTKIELKPANDDFVQKVFYFIYIISMAVTLYTTGFYSLKANAMLSIFSTTDFKSVAFSLPNYTGLLFENTLLESLFFFASGPCILFLLCYSFSLLHLKRRLFPLAITFIICFLDSYLRMARTNLYTFIICILLYVIIEVHNKTSRKKIAYILTAGFFILSVIFYIGIKRTEIINQTISTNLKKQIELFVIDYHTVGFALFDKKVSDPDSDLNQKTTYGRLTLGGIETVATLLYRQYDKSYYNPALKNAIDFSTYEIVGFEDNPTPMFNGIKRYNNFYTLLYTFFSDFGYFGIFIGGLILGFLLHYFEVLYNESKEIMPLMSLYLCAYITILSIQLSQLEIMRTWLLVGLLLIVFYLDKFKQTRRI